MDFLEEALTDLFAYLDKDELLQTDFSFETKESIRQRNNECARRHRAKRIKIMEELEAKIKHLTEMNEQLEVAISSMEEHLRLCTDMIKSISLQCEIKCTEIDILRVNIDMLKNTLLM